jgi:hypothetical protein
MTRVCNIPLRDQGCKYCGYERISEKLRNDFSIIENECKIRNFALLSTKDDYVNEHSILRFICNTHQDVDVQEITWANLKNSVYGCDKCYLEQMSIRSRGENGNNWQGGLTKLKINLRDRLRDWIQDVLRENNYKCVITGQGGSLEVHHLLSFNLIVKETLKS